MTAALQHLIEISGMAPADLARRAGFDPQALEQAIARHLTPDDGLLRSLGLDPGAFKAGRLAPHPEATASVWLFQSVRTSLQSEDISALQAALDWGRRWVLDPRSKAGQVERLLFRPQAVQGSHPAAAAQQGHRLARSVRAALQLGSGLIDDIVGLAELGLGVPVSVARLRTRGLRAAAIVAPERSAAGILINRSARRSPDDRVRVDVAHEICHILFDRLVSGQALMALDSEGDSEEQDLIEARARGFAAELLAPQAGLQELLGAPGEPDLEEGRRLVEKVRAHFQVPHALATYHLHNHGFLPRWVRNALLDTGSGKQAEAPSGTVDLPEPRQAPLCFGPPRARRPSRAKTPEPSVAKEAQARAEAVRAELPAQVVARAEGFCRSGDDREASLVMSVWVDDAMTAGRKEDYTALFDALVARVGQSDQVLSEMALLGVLTNSRRSPWPCEGRSRVRDHLFSRLASSAWPPEELSRLAERLG